ncbi:Hypothetical_protein [Hexamita inflata]|uniref:Hypothetical_protein n=1 Tax=Hexamita inflata TaxID=28002 RepID=A0AA86V4X9_9EUKA|nr:Hypothetical protein HINF_LOCUS64261 [Hexamita inflata]
MTKKIECNYYETISTQSRNISIIKRADENIPHGECSIIFSNGNVLTGNLAGLSLILLSALITGIASQQLQKQELKTLFLRFLIRMTVQSSMNCQMNKNYLQNNNQKI